MREAYVKPDDVQQVLDTERQEINRRRDENGVSLDAGLASLAISGGGIRSATFALGVIQAFAKHGTLARFDYLSTVSGGGYIGSAISWLLRRANTGDAHAEFKLDAESFPYGVDDPAGEQPAGAERGAAKPLLRFLRDHGNYLTPGRGITLLSAAAVVLRSILLNLVVWVPLLVALFVCLDRLFGFPPTGFALPETVCCEDCPSGIDDCAIEKVASSEAWPLDRLRGILLGFVAVFVAACVLYSLFTGFPRASFGASVSRYRMRRGFERIAGMFLAASLAIAAVASLPWAARWLGVQLAVGGAAGLLVGAASGLASFFLSGARAGKLLIGTVATVGAAALLYGILLLAYWASLYYVVSPRDYGWWLVGAVGIAILAGVWVNLNHIGLHRFYRDRLMEVFMPPVHQVVGAEPAGDYTGPSPHADGHRLSAFKGDGQRSPYHLINTNLVLVDSGRRRFRLRGGDSFLLSPLYSGSAATGWRDTHEFIGDGMTLATAMAISGAAAHPNTGVGGVGITRSKPVSLLMALLNIRLGYWIRNPRSKQTKFYRTPSQFRALLYELGPWFYRETRAHLQISDGGHFENLGLYELVRRKVRLAVVLDGGADPHFAFGDLQTAARRIAEDFGVRLEFDPDHHVEKLMPTKDAGYPAGTKLAERGWITGRIVYPAGKPGTLIYVKTTMIPHLGLRVQGYKGANPAFPDQATADQFFDEAQFDAYRTLGYRIGESVEAVLREAIARLDSPTPP